MNAFNTIVLTVAVIFLILILTAVGVMMLYTSNNNMVYPPTSSTCPDYWAYTGGNCVSNGTNEGTVAGTVAGSNNGPVSGSSGTWKLDPADSYFTKNGISKTCGQKRWAVTNGVVWDGVSNYNKC
jgi:hypothetical protein